MYVNSYAYLHYLSNLLFVDLNSYIRTCCFSYACSFFALYILDFIYSFLSCSFFRELLFVSFSPDPTTTSDFMKTWGPSSACVHIYHVINKLEHTLLRVPIVLPKTNKIIFRISALWHSGQKFWQSFRWFLGEPMSS